VGLDQKKKFFSYPTTTLAISDDAEVLVHDPVLGDVNVRKGDLKGSPGSQGPSGTGNGRWADVISIDSATYATYTMTGYDVAYIYNTNTRPVSATTSAATGNKGRLLYLENKGGNPLLINRSGSEVFESGGTQFAIPSNVGVTLISNGTGWVSLKTVADNVPLTTPLPSNFFGIHYSQIDGDYSPYSTQFVQSSNTPFFNIGFGTMRIWDVPGCTWAEVHTADGVFDFTLMDIIVNFAVANGMEIIYTMGQAPIWATGGTQQQNWNPYNSRPPLDNRYWTDYVTAVATRYLGKIKNYEIWNEPNWTGFWTGTTAQMVTLTQLAYGCVKAVDPTALVLSPAYDTAAGISAFDAFLAAGGGAYFDVVACHLYTTGGPPENMIPIAQQYRATAYKYGLSAKPIWCTEVGWLSATSADTGLPLGVVRGSDNVRGCTDIMSNKQSAAYAMRMYMACWVAGLDRCCLYTIDSVVCSLRLLDTVSQKISTPTVMQPVPTLNDAGRSLARFIQWAVGRSITGFNKVPGAYLLSTTSNSGPSWVVWTDDASALSLPFPLESGVGQVTHWDNSAANPLDAIVAADYAPAFVFSQNERLQQPVTLPNVLGVQSVEVDNIGDASRLNMNSGIGLSLRNATPGTSSIPIQDSPAWSWETQNWVTAASASQTLKTKMFISGNPDGSNFAIHMYGSINGVVKEMLNIDYLGQFGVPMAFAYWDARDGVTAGSYLQKGQACSNSAPATASYNQFSPYHVFFGQGWCTGSSSSKYMGIGFLVAPETGTTYPVGVYKACFAANNDTLPVMTNEAYRIEWGDRLGIIFNKLGLAGWATTINGEFRHTNPSTPPSTASSAGVQGTITWDANYVYVCVATNTWKRFALSTW